jgi:hypothetical protein
LVFKSALNIELTIVRTVFEKIEEILISEENVVSQKTTSTEKRFP